MELWWWWCESSGCSRRGGKSLITFRRFIDPPSQMYGIFIIRFRPPLWKQTRKRKKKKVARVRFDRLFTVDWKDGNTKSFYKLMIFSFLSTENSFFLMKSFSETQYLCKTVLPFKYNLSHLMIVSVVIGGVFPRIYIYLQSKLIASGIVVHSYRKRHLRCTHHPTCQIKWNEKAGESSALSHLFDDGEYKFIPDTHQRISPGGLINHSNKKPFFI